MWVYIYRIISFYRDLYTIKIKWLIYISIKCYLDFYYFDLDLIKTNSVCFHTAVLPPLSSNNYQWYCQRSCSSSKYIWTRIQGWSVWELATDGYIAPQCLLRRGWGRSPYLPGWGGSRDTAGRRVRKELWSTSPESDPWLSKCSVLHASSTNFPCWKILVSLNFYQNHLQYEV